MRPLSTPLRPSFGPQSSMRMPSERLAGLVAQRHEQRVHAALLALCGQLGEHDRQPAVARGVADVVLARVVVGRVDDELLGLGVIGRRRAERLDVGAVAGLGHGEAAGKVQRGDVAQVALVVGLGAEMEDRAAEQAELHAALDEQAQVAHGERLERGHALADGVLAAVLDGVAHGGVALGGELARPVEHLLAMLLEREVVDRLVAGLRQPLADLRADLGIFAVQQPAQCLPRAHAAEVTQL